ncbi:hypothetical protein ASAP_2177 [Asaia bogorensis]|uniref:Uncharacterized protein n=1 Tax=Asaia bogorensis TaxID=91915 RepID=A0A060QLD0_9PROT|nr:hypothetical protein ASAP_2177 [Asaia bogorensis]
MHPPHMACVPVGPCHSVCMRLSADRRLKKLTLAVALGL